jgi:hypothetical protein
MGSHKGVTYTTFDTGLNTCSALITPCSQHTCLEDNIQVKGDDANKEFCSLDYKFMNGTVEIKVRIFWHRQTHIM